MAEPSTETVPERRAPAFADHQLGIYARGLADQRPALPMTSEGLERRARQVLTPEAYGYVGGGAGAETTVRANLEAFARWEIVPRMLRDVSTREVSTSVVGTEMPAPLLLAPVGVQSIVHPQAELAVARAAATMGVPYILSTAASHSMEEVADAAVDAARWYQLYWPKSRDLAGSFLDRAAEEGFAAVVVTLDTWLLGWRPRDLEHAYLPFLKGEGVANYFSDPVFRAALDKPPEADPGAAVGHWAEEFSNPAVTWNDLAWLRERTRLPIILKGILHPDDARQAVDRGMDGLIVSNHGGRQVDGAVAALDALPAVREAVGAEFPVLFDSGIRTGADIFKAVALGAVAACVGRPYVWGLALDGEAGVEHVLRCLLAELDLTLALSGHPRLSDVDRDAVQRCR